MLTGGGARLPYMTEIAEVVLRRPARLAMPAPLAKMPAVLAEPEFATVIGLILYGHRARLAHGLPEQGLGAKLKALFARKEA